MFILLLMMPIIALLFMMVSGQYDITGRPQTRDEIAADLTRDIEEQIAQLEADGELTEEAVNDISEDYLPASTAQQLIVMFGLALTQAGTFGASYEIVKAVSYTHLMAAARPTPAAMCTPWASSSTNC